MAELRTYSGKDKFMRNVMPFIYGWGAAIVIVGAMFKIMHWPGAGPMLVVGLSTEAVIFMLSVFEAKHEEPYLEDWVKVYPQMLGASPVADTKKSGANAKDLNTMLADANINQDVVNKLGQGFQSLTTTVAKMNDISDATVATKDYVTNVKAATTSITEMNKSYSVTVGAMNEMANATKDAKEYHGQVQNITKNLGALNAVYEMELQDANNHLKSMNKFYSNLTNAMQTMAEANKDTQQLKDEMGKLAKNLTTLNSIYGGMVAAMKG